MFFSNKELSKKQIDNDANLKKEISMLKKNLQLINKELKSKNNLIYKLKKQKNHLLKKIHALQNKNKTTLNNRYYDKSFIIKSTEDISSES